MTDGFGLAQSQYDISSEECDKLVADVMRFMLFKNHQHPGVPVRREELTQIITKTYKQRNLPSEIISQAQKKFASIFGYEMKELQRSRTPKNNQIRSSQSNIVESKLYILKSMLPEELRTKFVEDKNNSQFLGLTVVVLSILHLAGGKLQEDTLWQYLSRFGLNEQDECHPDFGNVKQALETITKQKFIQRNKVSGPEGNFMVYELGERALDETVNGRLKEYITQIARKDSAMVEEEI
eukprot:TRINITY_DN5646_c0_g1_i1.p1 TRINITY_DN5646_c0_g1~~TRINITY_DN5646_c0_g1_i1.p1  ORF type:complete len:238 (-),score=45.57 TRINITY_DN5646_c0_g1_i1:313-1026(-)